MCVCVCVWGGGGGGVSSCLSTDHWYNKGIKESVGKGFVCVCVGGGGVVACQQIISITRE